MAAGAVPEERRAGAAVTPGPYPGPPLVFLAIGLCVGDSAALWWPMLCTAPGLCTIGACSALLWTRGPLARRWVILLLAALYAWWAADRIYRPEEPAGHIAGLAGHGPVPIEGRIAEEPELRFERGSLIVEVDRAGNPDTDPVTPGRIRLGFRRLERTWKVGDRVRFRVSLRRVRNFGTPGEYDFAAHLARRRVRVTAYMDSDSAMELVERPRRPAPLAQWRDRIGNRIREDVPAPAAGVLQALLIGSEQGIAPSLRQSFSRTGVSHVLSISGLHVGLVAGGAFAVARWLMARSEWLLLTLIVPKWAAAAAVVPVLLYSGIAGSNVATLRSVLMVLVFLGATLVERRRHLPAGLAAAATAILLTTPGASAEISFQLSFVSVWALFATTRRFENWWAGYSERRLLRLRSDWTARLYRPVLLYAAVSAGAVAATTPLTAFHFNQVVPVAPLANALVVPPLGSGAVALGLLGAFCEPLHGGTASLLFRAAGLAVEVGLTFVGWVEKIPGSSLRVPTPTLPVLLGTYAALAVFLHARRTAARRAFLLLLALAGEELVRDWISREPGVLRVTFLGIGQGDAAVIETPSGRVLVLDGGGLGGGSFDVGERVLGPFLWSRGIRRVHAISYSHPQFDHYGGLAFVAANFQPREVWSTGEEAAGVQFQRFRAAWEEAGAVSVAVHRGDQWSDGSFSIEVLGPTAEAPRTNPNDNSLVLRLRYAGVSLLFTGDIEEAAERELLDSLPAADLHADILKVAHHGSRTSSTQELLRAVRPRLAVIPVGADNKFRFPHPSVVSRLTALGARVLRTDVQGAVEVRVSPGGEVRTVTHRDGRAWSFNAG